MKKILEKPIKLSGSGVITMPRKDLPCDLKSIEMKTFGNLWIFEVNLPKKGLKKGMHKHEFDHMHLIVSGKALIEFLDEEGVVIRKQELTAPEWVAIPKLVNHEITSLEDNTIGYCIHAIRNQNDEVVATAFKIDSNIREVK